MTRTIRRNKQSSKRPHPFHLAKEWQWDHRRQEPRYEPEYLAKLIRQWLTDSDYGDKDKCPPLWFRQSQQRKHRHAQDAKLREFWMDDPIIQQEYKMPWYT